MAETIPAWCEVASSAMWPTRILEDRDLGCALRIHEAWAQQPQEITTPMDIEHQYIGRNPTEGLFINMMPEADPQADIANWVNSMMRLVGFPILKYGLNQDNPPKLLTWQSVDYPDSLAQQLAVDEMLLFEGLAQIPDLMRIYMLLARRDTVAWKVTLTIASACLPGSDEETIATNDHVRAGATFGYLRFR